MADLVFVLVIVVFFTLAVGLVRACERLVGTDATASPTAADRTVTGEAEPSGRAA
jgi:hypothetical protein